VEKTGERWYEAELYRLKGTLTLQSKVQSPRPKVEEEAEECFWKAIEVARQQQAKSWELRAAMSLSQLWQSQGKKAEARKLLAEIYGWFTEGFDTKDLQEAKALLEELGR
jgi:predicted ATPase